jgi:aspartate/tyrosine/aromatic aminotransferase
MVSIHYNNKTGLQTFAEAAFTLVFFRLSWLHSLHLADTGSLCCSGSLHLGMDAFDERDYADKQLVTSNLLLRYISFWVQQHCD